MHRSASYKTAPICTANHTHQNGDQIVLPAPARSDSRWKTVLSCTFIKTLNNGTSAVIVLSGNSYWSLLQQLNANVLRNDAYLDAIMHLHHIRYITFSHVLRTNVLLLQPDPLFSLPFQLYNVWSLIPWSASSIARICRQPILGKCERIFLIRWSKSVSEIAE